MPPILVPSSTKRIATQILVISKLNGEKIILRGFVCDIIRLGKELLIQSCLLKHKNKVWKLFKIKNEDARTLEICQCRHSSFFIVNCKDISIFVLIVEFEQGNICWVHIEKSNTFEDEIRYIMCYVVVFSVWTKFIKKWHLNLYHHNPTGESVRNFSGVYFRCWFWLKRCSPHSK